MDFDLGLDDVPGVNSDPKGPGRRRGYPRGVRRCFCKKKRAADSEFCSEHREDRLWEQYDQLGPDDTAVSVIES